MRWTLFLLSALVLTVEVLETKIFAYSLANNMIFLVIGAVWEIQAVWHFADFTMATMAFWNLIGVLALTGVIVKRTKDYMSRDHPPYR